MCGRYFLFLSPERLQQLFGTQNLTDYNVSSFITPMQSVPLIVQRRMGTARWGLLPDHAASDDKTLCAKLKNVRSETVAEKPSFANLWAKGRRCLIPASGFMEWPEEKIKGHPGFLVTAKTDGIGMAGIWTKRDDLVTFGILTKPAAPDLASIHSRMPVAFDPLQAEDWFAATSDKALQMIATESISDWQIEKQKPAAPSGGLFAAS